MSALFPEMGNVVRLFAEAGAKPDVAIVIPAKDEAKRIAGTLRSLETAIAVAGVAAHVVVVANNCTDKTAVIARDTLRACCLPGTVVSYEAEPNSVGLARRVGVELALEGLGMDGIVLNTDADCLVDTDWVADMLQLLGRHDVVCGETQLRGDEAFSASCAHQMIFREEAQYKALLAEWRDRHYPDPANPVARHQPVGGANIGFRVESWHRVGPTRTFASNEDRDWVDRAVAHGLSVHYAEGAVVYASPRLSGRAPDGMASAFAEIQASGDPHLDSFCEPFAGYARRLELRRAFMELPEGDVEAFARDVDLPECLVKGLLSSGDRGTAWKLVESYVPILRKQAMRASDLPREIAEVKAALSRTKARVLAAV